MQLVSDLGPSPNRLWFGPFTNISPEQQYVGNTRGGAEGNFRWLRRQKIDISACMCIALACQAEHGAGSGSPHSPHTPIAKRDQPRRRAPRWARRSRRIHDAVRLAPPDGAHTLQHLRPRPPPPPPPPRRAGPARPHTPRPRAAHRRTPVPMPSRSVITDRIPDGRLDLHFHAPGRVLRKKPRVESRSENVRAAAVRVDDDGVLGREHRRLVLGRRRGVRGGLRAKRSAGSREEMRGDAENGAHGEPLPAGHHVRKPRVAQLRDPPSS